MIRIIYVIVFAMDKKTGSSIGDPHMTNFREEMFDIKTSHGGFVSMISDRNMIINEEFTSQPWGRAAGQLITAILGNYIVIISTRIINNFVFEDVVFKLKKIPIANIPYIHGIMGQSVREKLKN